jgi:hypothetical protein
VPLQRPAGLEPVDAAVIHRHDEHPSVGEPAQATGPAWNLDDGLGVSSGRGAVDPSAAHQVAEPQRAVVPAQRLRDAEPVEEDFGLELQRNSKVARATGRDEQSSRRKSAT